LQQLVKQAQTIQQQMADAHASLAETELTGTSHDGLVTVTINGTAEVTAVKIDPKAVDPNDVETLEDLVVDAIRNATQALRELTRQRLGPLTASIEGLASGH
jgi:nucleoid-associated protein EbfC